MQFSFISPTQVQRWTADYTTYYMALVSDLQRNTAYAKFFHHICGIPANFITLNSYHDNVDEDVFIRWVRMLRPTEVVLPDVPNNREQTLIKAKYYIHFFDRYCNENNKSKYMVVPQGKNIEEWYESLKELLCLEGVQSVGVSKQVMRFCDGDRLSLVNDIKAISKRKHIHLLGTDNKLEELTKVPRKYKWIRSSDSPKIALMSHNNQLIKGGDTVNTTEKPSNFLDMQFNKEQITTWRENMHFIKGMLGHYPG